MFHYNIVVAVKWDLKKCYLLVILIKLVLIGESQITPAHIMYVQYYHLVIEITHSKSQVISLRGVHFNNSQCQITSSTTLFPRLILGLGILLTSLRSEFGKKICE